MPPALRLRACHKPRIAGRAIVLRASAGPPGGATTVSERESASREDTVFAAFPGRSANRRIAETPTQTTLNRAVTHSCQNDWHGVCLLGPPPANDGSQKRNQHNFA